MADTKTANLKTLDISAICGGAKLAPSPIVRPITTLLGNTPKILKVFSTASFENINNNSMDITSSDSEESCTSSTPIRKRQRLDHLTVEEKMMRRKLKNRVAAQTARDRKKARMSYLEDQMNAINTANRKLKEQNAALRKLNTSLTEENEELKRRLGLVSLKEEKPEVINEAGFAKSLELATPINVPQQKAQDLQTLVLLMIHCVFLPMMWSLTTSYKYSNSSAKSLNEISRMFRTQQTNRSPVKDQKPLVQWWGPQQKAWNPSENS